MNDKALREEDFKAAAARIGCSVAAIKAVAEIESNGGGFLNDGKPKILFESHVFHRQTGGQYSQPGLEMVSYPRWIRDYYSMDQYERLEKAKQLDCKAALRSASWGMFQIMGFNHAKAGYSEVEDFVFSMHKDEAAHLEAFVSLILAWGLGKHLVAKNWAAFAKAYNGPSYRENNYDTKIEAAYNKYKALSFKTPKK